MTKKKTDERGAKVVQWNRGEYVAVTRKRTSPVHYRKNFGNGYVPAVCGARGGRIADGEHTDDVTCTECLAFIKKG